MASIGELIASLGLDNAAFISGIAASNASMLGLSTSLSQLAVPALAIAGTVALAKGISNATDAAAKLQKSMANVATLVDKPQSEIRQLTTEVQDMTTEVLKSSADLAPGLYQVFSAGITDSADAMDVLKVSAIAATAGISDTRTSVDAITTILNAYNLEAREATKVSDLLFQTVRFGKTTYEELAGAIGTVTSIAATAGVELEDLFGILATLTKGGIETRRATTGLRSTLLSIIKPAEGAIKKAKELGLQWDVAAVRTKGLVGFLNDMRDAVNGDEKAIAELIPNARALSVVMSLVGKQNQELNRIMGEFQDVSGASANAFKIQADTVELQSKRMSLAIDRLVEDLGKLFLRPKQFVVSGLADFFESLSRGQKILNAFVVTVEAFQKLAFFKITNFGISVEEFTRNRDSLIQLEKEISDFAAGVSTILDQKLPSIIEILNEGAKGFPSVFGTLFDLIVEVNKKAAATVRTTWAQTAEATKKAFADLGIVPQAQFDEVIKNTVKSFEIVARELDDRGELNIETAGKVRQKLIDKLKGISDEAAESGFIINKDQKEDIEQLFTELGDSAVKTAQTAKRTFNIEFDEIGNTIDTTTVEIKKSVLDTDKFITDTATQSLNAFKGVGVSTTTELTALFKTASDKNTVSWTDSTETIKELTVSTVDANIVQWQRQTDGFIEQQNRMLSAARETAAQIRNISGPDQPEGGTNFHNGTLSAPRTENALIQKGELILPESLNPFNDNRQFNIDMSGGQSVDEFDQERRLFRILQQVGESRV